MKMFKTIRLRLILLAGIMLGVGYLLYLTGCLGASPNHTRDTVSLVEEWNRFILELEVNTEGFRGPVAALTYGYVGVAAYETGRPGFEGAYASMTTYFPQLRLPDPPAPEQFDMAIALNECYATILNQFFLSCPETEKKEMVSIEQKWNHWLTEGKDSSVVRVSGQFGQDVAMAVFAWYATDSLGFRANHHNYDRNYVPPAGEGKWVTSMDFPMPALLPYWGGVRPFIIRTDEYLAKELPPYSNQTNQIYHVQALELVSLSKPLSSENQWIAGFWNDDRPGLTFSPAGHWLAITNQVIQKEHPPIEKTLETYLKVGFALGDAMIACFDAKYVYNLERPETYIQKNIDKTWRPFSPSPSFPSYPSGHAMMGAAAAEVLTSLYGSSYEMTDRSHKDLEDFDVKPRCFTSFEQMAKENSLSRMLLGVHWRIDCEEGLRLGEQIGLKVSQLSLETPLTE